MVFPHYCDEAYEVKHSPTHRWFYKKDMEWDDVLLFKLGDNLETVAPRKSGPTSVLTSLSQPV